MDFYGDVFDVENSKLITHDEKVFDCEVVIFNKETN